MTEIFLMLQRNNGTQCTIDIIVSLFGGEARFIRVITIIITDFFVFFIKKTSLAVRRMIFLSSEFVSSLSRVIELTLCFGTF